MKQKKELDVDYIGNQDPLTEEEQKALSDFFLKQKAMKKSVNLRQKANARKRVVA